MSASAESSATATSSVQICRVPSTGEKIVRVLAGVVSLIGLAVGYFGPDWGYLITVFAALNVTQSAFTGFCPPEILYRWFSG
jgi:hypothetical protein